MLHCGHSAKRLFSRELRTRAEGPKGSRQQDSQCKAKNGVGTARLPPHSLCCLFSNLSTLAPQLCMPLNSVFRRLLNLRLSFTLSAPPISDSTPLRHIRFIRRSSRIHYSLHPSNRRLPSNFRTRPARTLTPRSSAHVRRSRAHQPRDRPPPQSSTAMARAPSNITSPARHSHRHPDPHPRAHPQPPFCPPTPHSQLPLAFRPQPSSTLRLPCASVCPHLTVLLQTAIPQQGAKGCAAPPVARCTSSWPYAIVQAPQKSPQASARAPPTLRDPPMGAASPERPPRPRARRRARWPPRARPPCL